MQYYRIDTPQLPISLFGTCLYSFVNRVLRDISAWRIWVPGAPRLLFS